MAAACSWVAACGSSSKDHPGGSTSHAGKAAAGATNAGSGGATTGGSAGSTSGAGNATSGSAGSSAAGSASGGTAGRNGTAGAGAIGESGSAGEAGSGGSSAAGGEAGDGAGNASATGGTGGRGGAGGTGGVGGTFAFGGRGGDGVGGGVSTNKIDLLFVVDNSISMYEKQAVLSATLPRFVGRLVDPWCTDGENPPVPPAGVSCPSGTVRELPPVTDMHVGVITTSLGAHGSHDVCSEEQATANGTTPSNYDDHAHLLPAVRSDLPEWNGSGFLKWDPQAVATPPGQNDVNSFIADVREVIGATGAVGCGYESTLEAAYRFLSDPEPPLVIDNNGSINTVSTDPSNIDQDVLDQRAAFLRPDSAVVVVSLSDEDDCSINDDAGRQGWLVGNKGGVAMNSRRMPRASSACDDPNDPCCRPCQAAPATGCPDNTTDPACLLGNSLSVSEDSLNLRCFQHVQRFGVDLLYPLSRYADGFTSPTVPKRSGGTVPNPLLAGGRDPRLIVYAPIVGVPWQDLALDPDDADTIELASAKQLRDSGRWPALVGVYDDGVAPFDPFMVGSVDPRDTLTPNTNPFTSAPIVDETSTNPLATINGHEFVPSSARDDLQYACIFPLPTAIDCTSGNADGCDCDVTETYYNRPLCQPPGGGAAGTTQYFAKAYPGVRHLEVARRIGDQAIPSSICARNTTLSSRDDYGYVPAMRAIQARLTELLTGP